MKKSLKRFSLVLIHILIINVEFTVGQNFVCNEGFENPNFLGLFPTSFSQVVLLDCWVSDPTPPAHTPEWMHAPLNFKMQEDLDNDGVFEDIMGQGNSRGYIGMRPSEAVFQSLDNALIKDEFYGIRLFVRIPHRRNRFFPDSTSVAPPADGKLKIEVTLSKNLLSYDSDDDCKYKYTGQGSPGDQVVTHEVDFSNLASGVWHEVLIPPFKADKDWSAMALQTKLEGDQDCAPYILVDGVNIYGDCNMTSCETCTYVDGDIQPTSNLIYTGQEPLEFYGLTNVSAAAITITSTNGSLIHSESFNCAGGWVNDTLQINLDQYSLGTQYYYAQVLFTNDCNACLKTFTFLFEDFYNQGFESCTCRTENLIKPCCETETELIQPGLTCSTPQTLNYEIIDDMIVGVSNYFEVPLNIHMNLIAGNSIYFGEKFQSGYGTLRAEVIPCASNKRGHGGKIAFDSEDEEHIDLVDGLFNVYPNPSQGQVIVENITDLPGTLRIIDLEGRQIETFNLSESTAEILQLQLSNGFYLLQFSNEYGIRSEQIVISKP